MFNSAQTNEEQPVTATQILLIQFSLMIMEVSEYEFINLLMEFTFLSTSSNSSTSFQILFSRTTRHVSGQEKKNITKVP